MKQTNTQALKDFLTDDQILECLVLFESRKMEAAKTLSAYMFQEWKITTLEAIRILQEVQKEWV